ncbi:Extensin-like [Caenorhabditis elegans]|nr:Extensin-like [Caenorhabditis elegans]CCD62071.1 Extensin-like [Caenorhabditis elegans]|eukprot:NP_001041077.1 Uncharacterized protein CELE_B0507.3 [Caenorhabditis elegans]
MLLNMSKLITLNQAHSHPTSIAPSSFQVPVIPPPPTLVTGPLKVAPASLAPVPMEIQSQEQPIKKSPAPTPSLDASNKPVAALASTPQQKESTKKTEKEQKEKAAPSVTAQPRIPHVPNTIPSKQFAQSAEVMMNDLQDKQRKLLSYISSAHNGSVTDEVLHDYLRHPFVLLKEKGVIRQQPNPFFHLMSTPQVLAGTPSVIPTPAMMSPNPAMVQKSSKPSTPIPAPPVLVPQVELPAKTSSVSQKTTVSPPVEKVTPPPQHPPQLSLQVPLNGPQMDPTKQFLVPMTRACNQWSVVSMALPLRLVCRCGQMPCRCQ